MNWVAFILFSWVALGLELGFRGALQLSGTSIAPSFTIPLMVYIALSAPPRTASWAAIGLGLLLDLTWMLPRTDGGEAYLLGPHAIAMLVAAQLVIASRGLVIRRHILTTTVLSILAAAVAQIVMVSFLTARSLMHDPIVWDGGTQLGNRLLSAIFTGGTGFVLVFGLRFCDRILGFPTERQARRFR